MTCDLETWNTTEVRHYKATLPGITVAESNEHPPAFICKHGNVTYISPFSAETLEIYAGTIANEQDPNLGITTHTGP